MTYRMLRRVCKRHASCEGCRMRDAYVCLIKINHKDCIPADLPDNSPLLDKEVPKYDDV